MSSNTFTLYTIGYESSSIDDFIDTLVDVQIEHVVDVRDVPASRKRGFSKCALSERLHGAGISYTHLRALGDPPEGRAAMRAGNRQSFLQIFGERLATAEAQSALECLRSIAASNVAVLLCFERDPADCHRSLIGKELAKDGATIKNIGVRRRTRREVESVARAVM